MIEKKCKKCGQKFQERRNNLPKLADFCGQCILDSIASLPNPYCHYCDGEGEYYGHSDDCDSNDCVLAGGYDDCVGQMIKCGCSILDGTAFIDLLNHKSIILAK